MNTTTTLTLSVLLSTTIATGVNLALREDAPAPTTGAPAALEPDRLARLEALIEEAASERRELTRAVDELALQRGGARPERVDARAIEAIVDEHLARHSATLQASAGEAEAAGVSQQDKEARFAALFEGGALGENLGPAERQAAWKKLADDGLAEEALAWYEARAEANPNDPDLRVDLGEVYLLHLQEAGNGPLAGVLATKADKAFDAALELDPGHWEARFDKAVALSFWPPVFGKQKEAISHFEQLIEIQSGRQPEPQFAQTHLLLGNMYQQLGQADQARAAWAVGAQLFPDDEALARQLELGND